MADFTIAAQRPKSDVNNDLNIGVVDNVVAIDSGGEQGYLISLSAENVAPNPASFVTVGNCNYSTGSTTVTTTGNGFSNVREGDAVSNAAQAGDFISTQYVQAKTDGNTIVLSALPDAAVGDGSPLTFTPPTTNLVFQQIKILQSVTGGTVKTTVQLFDINGANVSDGDRDGDTWDNITTPTTADRSFEFTKSMDEFYTNARVDRSI